MPLDGHSYLVAQGWSGTGTGLRTGAISRPLAIPQKKNLAGLGKDRDEAFPFWDHLFTAAASAIKIKAADSDEDSDVEDADQTTPAASVLKRTSTGIISNRRPVVGTPASSGTSTPDAASASSSATPRLSLMAIAKRQAAQRGLYSRFFRGPVLGPDDVDGEMVMSEIKADGTVMEVAELASGLGKGKGKAVDEGSGDEEIDEGKKEKKKRKVGEVESKGDEEKERKRRKELKEAEKRERRERKRVKKAKEAEAADGPDDGTRKEKKEKKSRNDNDIDEEMREARKRRKLERRNEQPPAPVDATSSSSLDTEDTPRMRKRKKHTGVEPAPVQDTPKESKKKRKREKHESS